MKKKWLLPLLSLTLALTTVGAAFALTSAGGGDSAGGTDTAGEVTHGDPTYEEWLSNYQPNQGPVTSVDDIDPNECNWIHNIAACEGEPGPNQHDGSVPDPAVAREPRPGVAVGEPYPLPVGKECGPAAIVPMTSDGQFTCFYFGTGTVNDEPGGQVVEPQPPITSIDDIAPDVWNGIHNISACTLEELEELGYGEVPYEVQSHEEAVAQDCGLAGGAVYITCDGEVGCTIFHDGGEGGVGETQAQPPAIVPTPEIQPSHRTQ